MMRSTIWNVMAWTVVAATMGVSRAFARADADFVTPANYTQFCNSNEALLAGKPRAMPTEGGQK